MGEESRPKGDEDLPLPLQATMDSRAQLSIDSEDSSRGAAFVDEPGVQKPHRFESVTPPEALDAALLARLHSLEEKDLSKRFDRGNVLGEGGMGEVRLHRDRHIGRDVAIKTIRGDRQQEPVRRFLREARVQGQLEHPAIVPVYDLGVDPEGAPFFVMKRVQGRTLEEIIEGMKGKNPETLERFPRRRLLDHFVRAIRAIEFAHARGVVHRDLKPANIMLGGFGEVYVLDWGVAKVRSEKDVSVGLNVTGDIPRAETGTGNILGTLAYMAPEQFRGEDIDERADVFSLGAILFEMLTLHLFYGQDNIVALSKAVRAGVDPRISHRFPALAIPPELEAIVVAACTFSREERLASVAEFANRLESYLEGDRNLGARRQAAGEHVARARALVRASTEDASISQRAEAVREVSRALALDPQSNEAFKVLVEIIESPPDVVPEELRAEVDNSARENAKNASYAATFAYASWLFHAPFYIYLGVRDLPLFICISLAMGLAAVLSFVNYKRDAVSVELPFFALGSFFIGLMMLSRVVSGVFFTPASVISSYLAFSMNHPRTRFGPPAALALLTCLLPPMLEWAGFFPPTLIVENGRIVILPNLISFEHGTALKCLFLGTNLAQIITYLFYARTIRKRLRAELERNVMRNWYLQHLLPHAQKRGKSMLPSPLSER